jgi:hypothetical protein
MKAVNLPDMYQVMRQPGSNDVPGFKDAKLWI